LSSIVSETSSPAIWHTKSYCGKIVHTTLDFTVAVRLFIVVAASAQHGRRQKQSQSCGNNFFIDHMLSNCNMIHMKLINKMARHPRFAADVAKPV
jgi:hypothetical protein